MHSRVAGKSLRTPSGSSSSAARAGGATAAMDESAAMPEPLTNPRRLISVFIRFTVPFHTRQRRKPDLNTLEAPVTAFYGTFLTDLGSRVLAGQEDRHGIQKCSVANVCGTDSIISQHF